MGVIESWVLAILVVSLAVNGVLRVALWLNRNDGPHRDARRRNSR